VKKRTKKNGHKRFWLLGRDEVNTGHLDISPEGELVVREGNYQYNIADIVRKFGTSTELFFPTIVENRVRDLIETWQAFIKVMGYRGRFHYHYPMKVNQNREFVLPAVAEGANLETSSANELFLVKRMLEQDKLAPRIRVLCNGPKSERYMALIEELRGKGLTIIPIIENAVELERMKRFKGEVGIRVDLSVRVKSHWDKRYNLFGFSEEELLSLGKIKNLSILHYHVSSQIETLHGFTDPLKRAIALYAKMREKNPQLDTINIGGGAGVPYEKKKRFYTGRSLIKEIVKTAQKMSDRLGIKHPNLICEWGRYVMSPAQMTIYKVIAEKPAYNKGGNAWYVIDGSFMNDLLDTWALKQKWHVVPVNHLHARKMAHVWIAGSSCDTDDRYTGGSDVTLPRIPETDDLYIAFLDTGAYQDALASHHCLLSSPLKLAIQNGEIRVIRKRETAEDVGKRFGW
jgi:arginine decarboxylase